MGATLGMAISWCKWMNVLDSRMARGKIDRRRKKISVGRMMHNPQRRLHFSGGYSPLETAT
jgi:hypothetical protein